MTKPMEQIIDLDKRSWLISAILTKAVARKNNAQTTGESNAEFNRE